MSCSAWHLRVHLHVEADRQLGLGDGGSCRDEHAARLDQLEEDEGPREELQVRVGSERLILFVEHYKFKLYSTNDKLKERKIMFHISLV